MVSVRFCRTLANLNWVQVENLDMKLFLKKGLSVDGEDEGGRENVRYYTFIQHETEIAAERHVLFD